MKEPAAGDHLVSRRTGYSHHGLYIGGGRVIHYAGFCTGWQRGKVELTSLPDFESGRGWAVRPYARRAFTRAESIGRAQSRIGEDHYCLVANNCEHFVAWCINGDHNSFQVTAGAYTLKATAVAGGGISTVAAVGSLGIVAGLSGSGIMSGLATIGGLVGGGAVAGLGIIGAAPAVISTLVLNYTVMKDNPALDEVERAARSVGRVGTSIGAAAGTVGGLAAVYGMGSVAGFSGAGIASGLAAIGSATGAGTVLSAAGVGGSMMMGGVMVTVAAPALIAAAAGYAAYRGLRWARSAEPPVPRPIPLPGPAIASVSIQFTLGNPAAAGLQHDAGAST